MRLLHPFTLAACLVSTIAAAGEITEKTDRFRGTKTVSWESYRDPGRGFSYNVYAHFAKPSDKAPYRYYAILVPPAGTESFGSCSDNVWLIDDVRAPELEASYDASSGTQMFRTVLNRDTLEKLGAAKSVEFKICNTEAAVSQADLVGIRQLLEATK